MIGLAIPLGFIVGALLAANFILPNCFWGGDIGIPACVIALSVSGMVAGVVGAVLLPGLILWARNRVSTTAAMVVGGAIGSIAGGIYGLTLIDWQESATDPTPLVLMIFGAFVGGLTGWLTSEGYIRSAWRTLRRNVARLKQRLVSGG